MQYNQPKKSLGQNFLTSIPARIAIVKAGDIMLTDTIFEVGPGRGFLTEGLLGTGAHVVALEKDQDLIPVLSEKFSQEITKKQFTLLEGDVLEFDPSDYFNASKHSISTSNTSQENLSSTSYKLIANIPYYITGAILSRYLSHTHQPSVMVVLVQKEVAERVCARDKKESLLSLSVKVYGEPKVYYRVARGSFNPAPNVDSAVLQIKNITRNNFKNQYHEAMFFKLIHAGFAHKRKFAISNIKQVFNDRDIPSLFQAENLSEKVRAEDVTLDAWLHISLRLVTPV